MMAKGPTFRAARGQIAVDVRGSVMPAWRWDVVESPGGKLVKRFKTDAALHVWLKHHEARGPNPLLAIAGNPGEDTEECIYCLTEVPARGDPPRVGDDEAWKQLAREHAPDCEWIETRAHRVFKGNPGGQRSRSGWVAFQVPTLAKKRAADTLAGAMGRTVMRARLEGTPSALVWFVSQRPEMEAVTAGHALAAAGVKIENVVATGADPAGTVGAFAGNPPVHDIGGGHLSYESKASLLAPGPGAWQRIKHIGSLTPAQVRAALGVESRRIQGEGAAADDSGDLWPAWRDESAPAGPKVTPPKPGAKSWYVEPSSYAKKHGSPGPHKDSWSSLLTDAQAAGLKSAYIGDMSRKQIETALKGMAGRMAEGGAAPDTGEPWPNPGSMKWGPRCEYRSRGPFATVAALHAAATELLRRVHPESQMAAAARLALRSPDMVMAAPVYQAALVDMLLRYPATRNRRPVTPTFRADLPDVTRRLIAGRARNPGGAVSRGRVFGSQVEEVKYRHVKRGARVHTFAKRGTKLEALPDGSVRIFNPKSRLWEDRQGT